MKRSKIKTLSLFSGAGGLDIGFHNAGFEIVACVELEGKYCKTLERNKESFFSKNTVIHNIDIRDFDVTPYANNGIECIIGGPPCQTFSAAGRRSGGVIGTDDLRGQLYSRYCEILDIIKPSVFVFENVYGLPGANGGKPWKEILDAFSQHGYSLTSQVLDAADYGVPQHRERLIMVGKKNADRDFQFPMPTVGPDSLNQEPLVSVLDAIGDLQSKNEPYQKTLGGLYGHLLPDVPEGLNYSFFTAEMGHPEPVFAWRSKFHDLLYKVKRDEPCRTIKANPGKFTGPFHWKNRHFTTSELKRLQTFPDSYELVGSQKQIMEQIGNSVPPQLAFVLASSVREQILRPKKNIKYKTRPHDFKSTFRLRQRERNKKFKLVAEKAIKTKYGEVKHYSEKDLVKPATNKHYSLYREKFSCEKFSKKPKETKDCFSCVVTDASGHVRLDIDTTKSLKGSSASFEVRITGLRKYLPNYDSLTASANLDSVTQIFFVWKEIEEALVSRSRFFTLIDIYGHYANRGDVVDIETEFKSSKDVKIGKLINYFGQTSNCGDFISERKLLTECGLSEASLAQGIRRMREIRFDIRSYDTHPIIGSENILCTYPFPLLSKKALVTSKVKLNREK